MSSRYKSWNGESEPQPAIQAKSGLVLMTSRSGLGVNLHLHGDNVAAWRWCRQVQRREPARKIASKVDDAIDHLVRCYIIEDEQESAGSS